MSQSLVYCAPDTRAFMAATMVSNGTKSVVATNHEGTPTPTSGLKYAGPDPALTETFLDLISGERFAKITAAQAAELDPDAVFAGSGPVPGLFVQVFPEETEEIVEGEETNGAANGATPRKKAKKTGNKAA